MHLYHDSYLYHNYRHPLFWIPIAPIDQQNDWCLAVERRVEVVELQVLLGRRQCCQRIPHNLLLDVAGCLLKSRCPLAILHSGWSCRYHWCSHCYMTYSVKIWSMSEHSRNSLSEVASSCLCDSSRTPTDLLTQGRSTDMTPHTINNWESVPRIRIVWAWLIMISTKQLA